MVKTRTIAPHSVLSEIDDEIVIKYTTSGKLRTYNRDLYLEIIEEMEEEKVRKEKVKIETEEKRKQDLIDKQRKEEEKIKKEEEKKRKAEEARAIKLQKEEERKRKEQEKLEKEEEKKKKEEEEMSQIYIDFKHHNRFKCSFDDYLKNMEEEDDPYSFTDNKKYTWKNNEYETIFYCLWLKEGNPLLIFNHYFSDDGQTFNQIIWNKDKDGNIDYSKTFICKKVSLSQFVRKCSTIIDSHFFAYYVNKYGKVPKNIQKCIREERTSIENDVQKLIMDNKMTIIKDTVIPKNTPLLDLNKREYYMSTRLKYSELSKDTYNYFLDGTEPKDSKELDDLKSELRFYFSQTVKEEDKIKQLVSDEIESIKSDFRFVLNDFLYNIIYNKDETQKLINETFVSKMTHCEKTGFAIAFCGASRGTGKSFYIALVGNIIGEDATFNCKKVKQVDTWTVCLVGKIFMGVDDADTDKLTEKELELFYKIITRDKTILANGKGTLENKEVPNLINGITSTNVHVPEVVRADRCVLENNESRYFKEIGIKPQVKKEKNVFMERLEKIIIKPDNKIHFDFINRLLFSHFSFKYTPKNMTAIIPESIIDSKTQMVQETKEKIRIKNFFIDIVKLFRQSKTKNISMNNIMFEVSELSTFKIEKYDFENLIKDCNIPVKDITISKRLKNYFLTEEIIDIIISKNNLLEGVEIDQTGLIKDGFSIISEEDFHIFSTVPINEDGSHNYKIRLGKEKKKIKEPQIIKPCAKCGKVIDEKYDLCFECRE